MRNTRGLHFFFNGTDRYGLAFFASCRTNKLLPRIVEVFVYLKVSLVQFWILFLSSFCLVNSKSGVFATNKFVDDVLNLLEVISLIDFGNWCHRDADLLIGQHG